jgi:hypothetical protein
MEALANTRPALSALNRHHDQILAMTAGLRLQCQDREARVRELFVELRVHSILEQQLLFPALAKFMGPEKIRAAGTEFYPMLALMLELEQMNMSGSQFQQTLADIERYFIDHVRNQSEHLFPELCLPGVNLDLVALDQRIEERMRELDSAMRQDMPPHLCAGGHATFQHTRCA